MECLAEHYAVMRSTTKIVEVKKIRNAKNTRYLAAKHEWYLAEQHGMIRKILVPDHIVHNILAVFGTLVFTLLILSMLTKGVIGNISITLWQWRGHGGLL